MILLNPFVCIIQYHAVLDILIIRGLHEQTFCSILKGSSLIPLKGSMTATKGLGHRGEPFRMERSLRSV